MKIHFMASPYPLSWAIKRLTRSDVSHVAVEFRNGDLLHAWTTGVKILRPDNFPKYEKMLYSYELIVDYDKEFFIEQELRKLEGKWYDYSAIAGFVIKYVAKLFGRDINNPWGFDNSFYCSEIVYYILQMIDVDLVANYHRETFDPETAKRFCEESDLFIRLNPVRLWRRNGLL
jgi:hypothetical protein